jgi:hypothetical protein
MMYRGNNHHVAIAGFLMFITLVVILHADGAKTLIYGYGKTNRLNMVFLAEGYTQAEQTKFINDVQANIDRLFRCKPWVFYRTYCNVYAISVVSAESGADHPSQGISKKTYFEATFGTNGTARRVIIKNESKVTALLAEHVPDYDFVCVLVNDQEYGGSGGNYAIATMNAASAFILLHEMGHSFADLADEYETAYMNAQEMKNVTANTQRSQIRWNVYIAPTTPVPTPETAAYFSVPGLFEGAMYQSTGWYRPKYNCTMRSAGNLVFCEICREETIIGIYNVVALIDSSFPSNAATIQNKVGTALSVLSMQPDSFALKIAWVVNSATIANTSNTLLLDKAGLRSGLNTVLARVTDTTGMVRIPANVRLLTDSLTWRVNNTPSATAPGQFALTPDRIRVVPRADGFLLSYCLPRAQNVRITLRDLRGATRYVVRDLMQAAGVHQIMVRDDCLGAGVYIMEFASVDQTSMQLIKYVSVSQGRFFVRGSTPPPP